MAMFKLSLTAKIMIKAAAVICFVLMLAGLVVISFIYRFEDYLPFVTGVVLGCILTSAKIIIIEKSVGRTLDMGEDGKVRAGVAGGFDYLARFILSGILLAAAFIFPEIIGRFGAIIGVLSIQPAAYAANIILRKIQPDNTEMYVNLNDLDDDEEE